MLAIAAANAAKGTAALSGTHYTPERSSRASEGQRGKVMGGSHARGPGHAFAQPYCLMSPAGAIWRGDNILDFVRQNSALFAPADIEPVRGSCNAAKQLCRLRPGAAGQKSSWKGWRWASQEEGQ